MITLHELLMEKFKVRTRAVVNPKVSEIGTTPGQILGNNPNRLAFVIINLHATQSIYLGLDSSVASTKGIKIDPAGGSLKMVWDEDFQITSWAIWGVGSGAGTTCYVLEVVSY